MSWDESRARDGIASIVADTEAALDGFVWPAHPLDDEITHADQTALYLGTGGMADNERLQELVRANERSPAWEMAT